MKHLMRFVLGAFVGMAVYTGFAIYDLVRTVETTLMLAGG